MNLLLEKNLGNTDRVIRAMAGAGLVGLVINLKLTGPWAVTATIFALSQFSEAYLGY